MSERSSDSGNAVAKIDYLEFAAADLELEKIFFAQVFSWVFTDYGEDYSAFRGATSSGEMDGGIYRAPLASSSDNGAALIVFRSSNLAAIQAAIEEADGKIVKPLFDFPGGQRFHFSTPNGNEFAVWNELT